MKNLFVILTMAALAFTPSLMAAEGKAPEPKKPACCDKAKKEGCPAEKGGCPKSGQQQCPASKEKAPSKS